MYRLNGPRNASKVFQELKTKLTTAPVLAVPQNGKDYALYCDASKNGLGCVLMQDRKVMVQEN
jgi:hypothetical protein